MRALLILSVLISIPAMAQQLQVSTSPEDAELYIITPADGAVVTGPFLVQFGLDGMIVTPAGIMADNGGHHHLLINLDELPDITQPLPATDQVIHFGGGQIETELDLPAGTHTLQLLLGNYVHVPHDPPVLSQQITITVKK